MQRKKHSLDRYFDINSNFVDMVIFAVLFHWKKESFKLSLWFFCHIEQASSPFLGGIWFLERGQRWVIQTVSCDPFDPYHKMWTLHLSMLQFQKSFTYCTAMRESFVGEEEYLLKTWTFSCLWKLFSVFKKCRKQLLKTNAWWILLFEWTLIMAGISRINQLIDLLEWFVYFLQAGF